jgi:hypothetical protein
VIEAEVVSLVAGSAAKGEESVESRSGSFAKFESAFAVKHAVVAKTSRTALENAFIQCPLLWR